MGWTRRILPKPDPQMLSGRSADAGVGSTLCGWVQAHLFAFLDGELNSSERQAAQTHLDACALCRAELNMCRQSELALATALDAVPPAGDLRSGFYTRLAASQSARPAFAGWRVAAPALAVCLLGLMLWRFADRAITPVVTPPTGEAGSSPALATIGKIPDAGSIAKTTLPSNMSLLLKETIKRENSGGRLNSGHEMKLASARSASHRYRLSSTAGKSASSESALPRNTFAMGGPTTDPNALLRNSAAAAEYADNSSEGIDLAAPIAPEEGFHLRVQDETRGFTATARQASYVTERNDERVVTIETDGDNIIIETKPMPDAH